MPRFVIAITCLYWLASSAAPAVAADWYVAAGANGTGTGASPFGRIQQGIDAAGPGDQVIVRPGTYAETLRTARAGTAAAPIVVRAEQGRGSVLVTASGQVLVVNHPYLTIDGLVLDGQYGAADAVLVGSGGDGWVLRDSEVRRSGRDCIDMRAVDGAIVERSLIHHCLNAAGGRTDAHGIVGANVRDLTIRDTEIHTFSGDAFQADPNRIETPYGWTRVTIERCRFWLAPLPSPENGFAAGVVPGENAVDTKTPTQGPSAVLVIRDTEAWGFRGGLLSNMAAFNIKEAVDALIDRVTVHDSEIAFRLRGETSTRPGAEVLVRNSVVYDVSVGARIEDNPLNLRIWHTTFGAGIGQPFVLASIQTNPVDVRNTLVFGTTLPAIAAGGTNRAVGATAFVDIAAANYRLAAGAPVIDIGVPIAGVVEDRDGLSRPRGLGPDPGAYEYCPAGCVAPPAPPTNVRIIASAL